MSSKQPPALVMAEVLERNDLPTAAAELRRQHALIAELAGHLEEALDDSEEVLSRMIESYGPRFRVERQNHKRAQIAAAREALQKAQQ